MLNFLIDPWNKSMLSRHEAITRGGWFGHWARRGLHVGMILVPWVYYTYRIPSIVLWLLLFVVVVVEVIRFIWGIQFFGQRAHEVKRISSFAWGAVSLFLVLLLTQPMFAYPIVAACALVDPLLGELRRFSLSSWLIALIGILFIVGLWLLAWQWCGTPWWWSIIMGPLIVAAEWPNIKWIDDNAMMQLAPLIVVLFVQRIF